MGIMEILSVATLVTVILAGALLKRHARKTLSDMDGVGAVSTGQDADVIARF